MPTVTLTDKRIRDLQPEAKTTFLWDAKLPGFGVRITRAGTKAFVVGYRSGRRWRLTTIGRVGAMSLPDAKKEARETLVAVRHGADPVAERAARRDALTLGALLDRWMTEHSEPNNRPSTIAKNRALIRRNLGGPLANTAAAEVTATDIEKLKTRLRAKPVEFNRTLSLLCAIFNFAVRREMVDRNPTASVTRYREQPRDRVLSADELRRIAGALADLEAVGTNRSAVLAVRLLCAIFNFAVRREMVDRNPTASVTRYREQPRDRILSADELRRIAAALTEIEAEGANRSAVLAVRLLAMTGWRISEIRGLRWEDLCPDRGEALLVATKTGTRWASISAEALAMIAETPRRGDYVFPGRSKAGNLGYSAISDVVRRTCNRAKVADVSPHTFRASAATSMAEAGASLFALREAFGWTGLAMPNRYVKRAAQSAREAVAQHGARTAAIMGGKPAAEVVEIVPVRKVRGDG